MLSARRALTILAVLTTSAAGASLPVRIEENCGQIDGRGSFNAGVDLGESGRAAAIASRSTSYSSRRPIQPASSSPSRAPTPSRSPTASW